MRSCGRCTFRQTFDGMMAWGTHGLDRGDDGVGVVAAVRHNDLCLRPGQQRQSFGELTSLSTSQPEANRLAQAVGEQVNLGAQSTSGTPQSLIFAPFSGPWPPAGEPGRWSNRASGRVLPVSCQVLEQPGPYASLGPAHESLVHTLVLAVALWKVRPAHGGPDHP